MHYGYIYKTINNRNNRIYIGKRKGNFDSDYYGSGIILQRALNKHGKDSFRLEVVVYANNKVELNSLEKQYIAEYRKRFNKNRLYNISDGGDGGNTGNYADINGKNNGMYGRKHSEETKQKIRIKRLGKRHSLETRAKISKATSGENHPMYGADRSGEKNPMFGIHRFGKDNPMYGRKHSENTKKLISLGVTRSKNE